MLMHDRIVGLPYKHIVQLWVERISFQPSDIAFVIGCIELNLAVAWNGGDFRSRLCAGHTDFKRTRSNFDGKRFAFLTVHADVVIHSDVAHQGSLGVVRAGSEGVDVIENRLFADGGLIEDDRNGCTCVVRVCDVLSVLDRASFWVVMFLMVY